MRLPVAKGLHTALEAYNSNLKSNVFGRLAHQAPDTVIGNEVHQDFFAYHLRSLAAKNIHPHGRLDIAEKQLHIPAPEL